VAFARLDNTTLLNMALMERRSRMDDSARHLGDCMDYAAVCSGGAWRRGIPHLELLGRKLEEAISAGGKRIIVMMPVRHGKSTLCSHYFPVSFLDRHPEKSIILCAYGGGFASGWGRKVRNTIEANEDALTVRIAQDSRAGYLWHTHAGGMMITAGVGGSITGRGANLLIIDDPVKDWKEAYSATYRDSTWDWFQSTAYTRVEPGGSIVILMARWHDDDLVGRLLKESREGGDQWDVIKITAVAEADDPLGRAVGDALWPDRYSIDALMKIKATTSPQAWAALYQQSPRLDGGNVFKRHWFRLTDAAPADDQLVRVTRFWDCAGTSGGGDWTVGTLAALLKSKRVVFLDVIREQLGPGDVDRLIVQTAHLDRKTYGDKYRVREEREGGSSGKAIVQRRAEALMGFDYKDVRPTGEKPVRWRPLAGYAELGNIDVMNRAWTPIFIDELSLVPASDNDDQADSAAGAFQDLTQPSTGFKGVIEIDGYW
jgi:predicted phage terminase large subunit-like protein